MRPLPALPVEEGIHRHQHNPDPTIAMVRFLTRHHSHHFQTLILSPNPRLHYPIHVEFAELMDSDPHLAHLVFSQPAEHLPLFDEAAVSAQSSIFMDFQGCDNASVKRHVHVRINVLGSALECPETFPSIGRIRVNHRGILLTLKGTVIRSGAIKMVEGESEYECRKCKGSFKVRSEVETRNVVLQPSCCRAKELLWSIFDIYLVQARCTEYFQA